MVVEGERAVEYGEDVAGVVAAHAPRVRGPHLVEQEEVARHEPLHGGIGRALRLHGRDRAEAADRLDAGIHVQRPRLAVGAGSVPVEESVGHVARLLDLGDQQAGADRVHRAGRNEDAVARAGLEGVQHRRTCAGPDRGGEFGLSDARCQTGVDAAAGLGIDHVPRFRLASVGRHEPRGTFVVGVHLHREVAAGVEKLEQQRERREPRMSSEELTAMTADEIAERPAGKLPGGDDALVAAVRPRTIDDFP